MTTKEAARAIVDAEFPMNERAYLEVWMGDEGTRQWVADIIERAIVAEREACAKIAEEKLDGPHEASDDTVRAIAEEIRARH